VKFAVFGAGGVGGYFGGRLAQAGHDVAFVARGAHLDAMLEDGLRVDSIAGDFVVRPVRAAEDPAAHGPVDVVLVAVKAWQVAEAAGRMAPLLGPETFVVPLENGVESADEIAKVIGDERVLGGLCKIISFVAGPGHIRHTGAVPRVEFGERRSRRADRVDRLRDAFARAQGVSVGTPPDIEAALWEKFLFIAPLSGVGAATRLPVGAWRGLPETRTLLEGAMREVLAVARARGVHLEDEVIERTLAYVDALPEEATGSMQRDLLEGRPSELDAQTGAVVRLGRAAGVPVPVSDALYAALLPGERRARGAGAVRATSSR
jgi:2-dehydropantoate 2-reductase